MSSITNVPLTLLSDKIVTSSLDDAIVAVAPDNDPVIVSPPWMNLPLSHPHFIVIVALDIVVN